MATGFACTQETLTVKDDQALRAAVAATQVDWECNEVTIHQVLTNAPSLMTTLFFTNLAACNLQIANRTDIAPGLYAVGWT